MIVHSVVPAWGHYLLLSLNSRVGGTVTVRTALYPFTSVHAVLVLSLE